MEWRLVFRFGLSFQASDSPLLKSLCTSLDITTLGPRREPGAFRSNGDLKLASFDGEGHSLFGPHFETSLDRLADVREGFGLGLPLAHAAGKGRALGRDPALRPHLDYRRAAP